MKTDNLPSVVSILSSFAFGFAAAYVLKNNLPLRRIFAATQNLRKDGAMKLALVVRTDLKMGKGKVAAQCSHAAVSCYKRAMKTAEDQLHQWERQGQTKVVLATKGEEGLEALAFSAREVGLIAVVIHDAGHTQVKSGSATVVGIGPGPESVINQVTGHLKLY